jgi:uncharacterized protein YbjT (DUF2867 family)
VTKVLVAGATGYLGKYVAREFKRRGYWVRALARTPDKLKVEGPFLEPAIADIPDDVFVGEATKPETLYGLCDGIEVVFSSIGITRQKDKLGYMDVDYQANKNILDLAVKSSVRKFIFIYGFNAHLLQALEPMRARHKFIEALRQTTLDYTVISPNGFFDDMSEFLRMAKRGTVYLIGEATNRINPIHGADLAKVCVDAATSTRKDIPLGGPIIYSYREIAELAFEVLGKPPRIRRMPGWVVMLGASLIRPFSAKYHAVAAGMATIMQTDFVAPQVGTHTLKDFYEELAPRL